MSQCKCQPVTYTDPNQLEFGFVLHGMRESKAYKMGYHSGSHWDANWIAGGPYVSKGDEQSKIRHSEWVLGFNEGLQYLLSVDSKFAAWWKENKGKLDNYGRGMRYGLDE